MKISRNQISETKIELKVELSKGALEDARLVSLKKLAKDAKVPGFRSGKAPANVVEKHIDPNTLAEATLENAVSKAVAEAFIEEDIRALERPQVNILKYIPGELLEFSATAEIIPEVKLGNYKKLKSKMGKVEVVAKEIDAVLTNLQSSFAEKEEVKRAAKLGDEVLIDFVGKKDKKPFDGGTAKDHTLKLGSNSFIPGFEEGVVGHKAGDKFDIELTFPKDYHAKDLKGKKVVFEINLKKVEGVKLAKLDDDFAKKSGPFKTLVELKADIKKNLTDQKTHEVKEKYKDDLVNELTSLSKVVAPDILIEDQSRMIRQDMMQNLSYRGMTLEGYLESVGKSEDDWMKSDVKGVAEARVKAGLVLAELSKELKVDISDAEVDAKLGELMDVYKNNPEAVKQLQGEQVKLDIRNRLLTEKTIDELMKLN